MNGKKKTIRIARGQEDRAIIECIYQENLFFQELYEQARNCTNEILRVNEQVESQWENKCSQTARTPCAASGKNPNPISYSAFRSKTKAEYYSCSHFCNLIAFCADRGQGKTSAMLSYATALSNIQMQGEEDWRARKNKFWEDTLVGNAQYEVLRDIGRRQNNDTRQLQIFSDVFQHTVNTANIQVGVVNGNHQIAVFSARDKEQIFLKQLA